MIDDPQFLSSWSPGFQAVRFIMRYHATAVLRLSGLAPSDAYPGDGPALKLLKKWHAATPFDLRRCQPGYPQLPRRCVLDPRTGEAKAAELDWLHGIAHWDECGIATNGRVHKRAEQFALRLEEVQARLLAEEAAHTTPAPIAPVIAPDPAHEELKRILRAEWPIEILPPEGAEIEPTSEAPKATLPSQPPSPKRAGRRRMAATEAAEKAVDEFLLDEGIIEANDPRLFAARGVAQAAAEREADPEQEGDPVISDRTIRRLISQRVAARRKKFCLPD